MSNSCFCSCCRSDAEHLPRYSSGKSDHFSQLVKQMGCGRDKRVPEDCHMDLEVIKSCNPAVDHIT